MYLCFDVYYALWWPIYWLVSDYTCFVQFKKMWWKSFVDVLLSQICTLLVASFLFKLDHSLPGISGWCSHQLLKSTVRRRKADIKTDRWLVFLTTIPHHRCRIPRGNQVPLIGTRKCSSATDPYMYSRFTLSGITRLKEKYYTRR